jgi:cytidine deaminase
VLARQPTGRALPSDLHQEVIEQLATSAWKARSRGRVLGATQVGCAALDERGEVSVGCNVEHRFRSHDIHAEVNAIATLVTSGGDQLVAVFIVAERDNFTPCGSCLDWIFELGGGDCEVFVQRQLGGQISRYKAKELMPHYPF